ncbi:integrase [Mycolicibacterium phocaicum]|uniref:integrase n=1 Tax=Mycolicibacterium phocaicum TaxID=319706 RepID=UPI0010FD7469|nr:integrase [Mycolicibacterium phocaicum]
MSNPSGCHLASPLVGSSYAEHIVARLSDFFSEMTPWQRRLWDAGTVLTLRELLEAADWCANGVLSTGTVAWLAKDAERLAGRDRGVGEREVRTQLTKVLRSNVPHGSRHYRHLSELIAFVNRDYMSGWERAVEATTPASPERCARAIASHLLDCGYSMRYLRTWVGALRSSNGATLADLFDSAQELANGTARTYDVVVPFASLPKYKELAVPIDNWMSVGQMRDWLEPASALVDGLRLNGGFRYSVCAKDGFAAAEQVINTIDRLKARSNHGRRIGRRGPQPSGDVWVKGDGRIQTIALAKESRAAFVLSLEAERKVYQVSTPTAVDDALELAAPLNYGPPGPAVSGGWAAIEALLTTPDADDARDGRGVVAVDRMAALVAASWPRGELTTLSRRHTPPVPDRLSLELKTNEVNSERARITAEAIRSGRKLSLKKATDRASESRMAHLIANPRPTLEDVNAHMRTALRRFYRQRNILMHGGTTNSIALSTALRTAAPLVSAGLDRITHAALVEGITPLQLAARAKLNLELVGSSDGRHLVDLLEP